MENTKFGIIRVMNKYCLDDARNNCLEDYVNQQLETIYYELGKRVAELYTKFEVTNGDHGEMIRATIDLSKAGYDWYEEFLYIYDLLIEEEYG